MTETLLEPAYDTTADARAFLGQKAKQAYITTIGTLGTCRR